MIKIEIHINSTRLKLGAGRLVRWLITTAAVLAVAAPIAATAAQVNVPNTFTDGAVISANEFNENFDAVGAAVNDNDSRVEALETALAALETRVAAIEGLNPAPTALGLVAYVGNEDSGLAPSVSFNSAGGANTITGAGGNYTVTIGNADCDGAINITHGGGTALSCRLQGGTPTVVGGNCSIPVTCYNSGGSLTATGIRLFYIE